MWMTANPPAADQSRRLRVDQLVAETLVIALPLSR